MIPRPPCHQRFLSAPLLFGALWLGVSLFGLAFLWRYENTPAPPMAAPATWPAGSRISRAAGLATLVMFAHPRCPCTRASIGELAELLAQCQGRLRAIVLFYKPRGAPAAWARTDLWRSAAAIPGVEAGADDGGTEAARFGALSSGSVLLYDAAGKLAFRGGITGERGHMGDNEGREAIADILHGLTPRLTAMPVLGCSLANPKSKCAGGAPP